MGHINGNFEKNWMTFDLLIPICLDLFSMAKILENYGHITEFCSFKSICVLLYVTEYSGTNEGTLEVMQMTLLIFFDTLI